MISFIFRIFRSSQFFAVAAFLFFSASFYPANLLAQDKPVGKILSVIGTVKFFAGDPGSAAKGKPGEVKTVAFVEPWKKVKKKQPVYAKDRFRTSRKSRLKILFLDNSLMALGPGAEMSIDAYRTEPKSKLRQAVVNVKRGLSMYIVNKSQKNKKSFFNIVTPTANLGARGTQGYVAVSNSVTLVANQAGAVATKSSDPSIGGQVNVGPMMKTSIPKGAPPALPTTLAANELATFRNMVVGDIAFSGGNPNSLITVDESKEEEEEEEGDEKEGKEGEEGEEGPEGGEEGEEGEEGPEGEGQEGRGERGEMPEGEEMAEMGEMMGEMGEMIGGEIGEMMGDMGEMMAEGGFDFEMLAEFEAPDMGEFGSPGDFRPVFDFFDDVGSESCSP